MTVAELNDLIARGAAQPGVRDVEELMRLSQQLDRQARELSNLYAVPISSVTSDRSVASALPTDAAHAHLG